MMVYVTWSNNGGLSWLTAISILPACQHGFMSATRQGKHAVLSLSVTENGSGVKVKGCPNLLCKGLHVLSQETSLTMYRYMALSKRE